MRKSNWIIAIIAVVASIVFLGLWYYLGFNHIDSPLDIVLAVVWWLLVIIVCVSIRVADLRRRQSLRTAFLGPDVIYNIETGMVHLNPNESYVPALQKIIANTDYRFNRQDAIVPDGDAHTNFNYIVRTKKFADNGEKWEGEVVNVMKPNRPRSFSSKSELSVLLGSRAA